MHIGERGIALIHQYEGLRLQAYRCSAGVWTIGWGWTGPVDGKPITAGMKITREKADELFKQGIVKYENYVNSMHLNLNQNQYDSLCSFVYNCGVGGLTSLCRGRNLKQISEALLLYNKAGGKVLAGLTKRRKAEQELFNTPVNVTINDTSNVTPKLPYKVKTKCDLNIRSAASATSDKIRVAKKGEVLTVWAIETNENTKWGRNGKEYFSLAYCEPV